MMNVSIVTHAAKDIEKCQTALEWLEKYGRNLEGRSGESFQLRMHLNHASACNGAKEAAEMLETYASLDIQQIVEAAISNCYNTIEIRKQQISKELNSVTE